MGSHSVPPTPQQALQQPTPLLETPAPPQASLSQSPVGSLLLSPGSWCIRFCCTLQETVSQSYVSSASSMVGLMVTSSKRAYVIPKPAALRAPSLWQTTTDPYLHRRCSNTVLSQSLERESRKSGNTWSNRQIWPWSTE